MKILVVGTNSNIGKILVPKILQMGIQVISVGRTHHKLSTERIDWRFGEEFPVILESDFVVFLPIDYSSIKLQNKFIADNTNPLFAILKNYEPSKIVIPLSFSASQHSKSRYGELKNRHEDMVKKHLMISLKIGWLDSPKNGGQITQIILKTLRKIPINVLPAYGNQTIYLTTKCELEEAVDKILKGHKQIRAFASNPTNLATLVYGKQPRYNLLGSVSHGILMALPLFYFCFPVKLIRAIDSARSLLTNQPSQHH